MNQKNDHNQRREKSEQKNRENVGGCNVMSEGIFKGEKCEFCGKPAENFLFAAFVCCSDECIEEARKVRGGPGGHIIEKSRQKD